MTASVDRYTGMRAHKRMQLAARGFGFAPLPAGGRSCFGPISQLRSGPPGGVWSVHGGRQLMRKPLGRTGVQLRLGAVSALVLGVGCASGFPEHGFPVAPPDHFVRLAETGCSWEASFFHFHHSERAWFGVCMASVGLYRGYARGLSTFQPPESDETTDLIECASKALEQQAAVDACFDHVGLVKEGGSRCRDEYTIPGAMCKTSNEAFNACFAENQPEPFSRAVPICLRSRGWTGNSIDSRGRRI